MELLAEAENSQVTQDGRHATSSSFYSINNNVFCDQVNKIKVDYENVTMADWQWS